MLPGMELLGCPNLAVPRDVMHHVVRVESSYNPYAIGVVGGRLVRQPRTLAEAVSTAHMLEQRGYNFSRGLAQVNRRNLAKYGLESYAQAFEPCANLVAGSRILRECHSRSGGNWGKSFSCYYSGNFTTGFRHGYVQKVFASMRRAGAAVDAFPGAIALDAPPGQNVVARTAAAIQQSTDAGRIPLVDRRISQVGRDAPLAEYATSLPVPTRDSMASAQVPDVHVTAPSAGTVGREAAAPASPPVRVTASRIGAAIAPQQETRARPGEGDGAFVF